MVRRKKSGLKGQLPLPFGKSKRVRRKPVYSSESLARSKELMGLRKKATDLNKLLRSNARVISITPELSADPDVRRGRRIISEFLREFNKSQGPGFHVSKARERAVSDAMRLIEVKWGHVLADAREEITASKELKRDKKQPRLF